MRHFVRNMHTMPSRDRTLRAFGRNVARIRAERGFSQDKLAEKADLDRTYISGIERGVRNPGIKIVLRIARALDVAVGELCKGVGA
jgi:transcriptional regulator with XRE-family HTH domain